MAEINNLNLNGKLNIITAKDALNELLKVLNEDSLLKETKETCSNDMLKYIQTFLPIAIDIQFKIIAKYGFSPDNTGLINFTNKLKDLSIEDDSIADLFENFKNLLIPPLNLKTHCV